MNNKEKLYLAKQARSPRNDMSIGASTSFQGSYGEGRIPSIPPKDFFEPPEDTTGNFRSHMIAGGGAGAGIGTLLGALYGGLKKPDEEDDESRWGNAAKYGLGGAALGGVSGAGLAGIDRLASALWGAQRDRELKASQSYQRDLANQEQLYDATHDTHYGINRLKEMLGQKDALLEPVYR